MALRIKCIAIYGFILFHSFLGLNSHAAPKVNSSEHSSTVEQFHLLKVQNEPFLNSWKDFEKQIKQPSSPAPTLSSKEIDTLLEVLSHAPVYPQARDQFFQLLTMTEFGLVSNETDLKKIMTDIGDMSSAGLGSVYANALSRLFRDLKEGAPRYREQSLLLKKVALERIRNELSQPCFFIGLMVSISLIKKLDEAHLLTKAFNREDLSKIENKARLKSDLIHQRNHKIDWNLDLLGGLRAISDEVLESNRVRMELLPLIAH